MATLYRGFAKNVSRRFCRSFVVFGSSLDAGSNSTVARLADQLEVINQP